LVCPALSDDGVHFVVLHERAVRRAGREAMVIDLELPWGREEIIEAMVAEYLPFDLDDSTTWPYFSQVRALLRLAASGRGPLGFGVELAGRLRDGGPISELEDAVFARLGRVHTAFRDGRDPDAAYEAPLPGEMH
jgi:hypothetical protein